MFRSSFLALVAALTAACAGSPSGGPAAPGASRLEQAAATITAADIDRRVSFLASDELRGRDTPSPGLERAAEWIAGEFARIGLEPAGDSGTFIQRWPYRDAKLGVARVRFDGGDRIGIVRPVYGRDFFLVPSGADSVIGDIVFVGTAQPGMAAPGDAVTGRLVAIYAPGDVSSAEFGQTIGGALMSVMPSAPAGIIVILQPGVEPGMIGQIASAVAGQTGPVPIVGIRWEAIQPAFAAGGADLVALRDRAADAGPVPIGELRATIAAAREVAETHPPNVVGILRGSDPVLANTYVVFSAHIDHVGVGAPDATGDSIFNGADDDASGTSVMLEVAEAFAALPDRPARSIIFLGVSGEEKGLLGSAQFVQRPPVPVDSMVANINLDMVGRNEPGSVIGIGLDYSSLGPLAQRIAADRPELGLTIVPDPMPEERLFFRSDHFNFATRGVPALFFTTGLHEDYHRQSDEPEAIDDDKAARVARLSFYLAAAIANATARPEWTEKGRAEVRFRQ